MTQSDENRAQINQLQALRSSRNRVTEVKDLMVPLVQQMAAEGNSLAAYLVGELERAEEDMALANMDAHAFVEESSNG